MKARRIKSLTIKGHSMLIIKAVKGEGRCRWKIKVTREEIHTLLDGLHEVHVDHTYWEGNEGGDDLAKIGHNIEGIKESDDVS